MEKFGRSQPFARVEDLRLLTGCGRFIDDIPPRGALFLHFLRSPFAHARIANLDVAEARQAPGVRAVLTLADLADMGMVTDLDAEILRNRDGTRAAAPRRPLLADGVVRHVGEAVAAVVAESLAAARDAAELIAVEYDDLPVHVAPVPGGPGIHPEAPANMAFDWATGDEQGVAEALAAAAHVIALSVADHRVIVNSLEPRGCYAAPMDDGRLHLAFTGQGVWSMKEALGRAFRVDPGVFRTTNPDIGGGFGMKGAPYPEYIVCAAAARFLGQPVRWMSDRTEAMLSDNGGRGVDAACTLGLDADLRITAWKVDSVSDLGAYNSDFGQFVQTVLWSKVLTGPYDIPKAFQRVRGIYTNTAPVDAYRGAGRPEAIYALERMMDYAAREFGVDPWDLRRRNLIAADRFPYRTPTRETYDVGDFHRVLDRAEAECDRAGFAARRVETARRGRLRGLGLCYYIESILGSPEEDATIEFLDDGSVALFVGTQSNGQGHETVFARYLADQTGIPFDRISVIQGDSDQISRGGGTGGSRSVTVQTNATLKAVTTLVEGFAAFLAAETGVAADAIAFDDERFRIPGTNLSPTLLEAATLARARGRVEVLRVTETARLPGRSYPNGAHVAEVEVDPETGQVDVVRYTVTDDFGNIVNPLLAEGQVHGGVAQGLGQALCERAVYDADGQLLTATFMDYAMPRAGDLPRIAFTSEPVPSTANILGMKGCGEAGTVGALAAVANAVVDALAQMGVRRADMPFTPHRVWSYIAAAR